MHHQYDSNFFGPLETPDHSYTPKYKKHTKADTIREYREEMRKQFHDKEDFYFFAVGVSNMANLDLEVELMGDLIFKILSKEVRNNTINEMAELVGSSNTILSSWVKGIYPDSKTIVYTAARIFPEYLQYLYGEIKEKPDCFHTIEPIHPGKICP